MMVNMIFAVLISLILTILTCYGLSAIAKLVNYVNETIERGHFFGLLVFIYWLAYMAMTVPV